MGSVLACVAGSIACCGLLLWFSWQLEENIMTNSKDQSPDSKHV